MKLAVARFNPLPNQWARNLSTMLDAIRMLAESHPAPDLIVLPGACDAGPVVADASAVTPAMCQTFRESVATLAREWGVWIACGHGCIRDTGIVQSASLFDPDGDAYIRPAQVPSDETPSPDGNGVHVPAFVADTPIGLLAVATSAMLADPTLPSTKEPLQVDLVVACCPTGEDAASHQQALTVLAGKWQANLCIASPAKSGGKQPAQVLDFTGKPKDAASVNAGAAWFGRIPLRFGGGRIGSRLTEEPPAEEIVGLE